MVEHKERSYESLDAKERERLAQFLPSTSINAETKVVYKGVLIHVYAIQFEDAIEMRIYMDGSNESVIVSLDENGTYVEGISGRGWEVGHFKQFLHQYQLLQ